MRIDKLNNKSTSLDSASKTKRVDRGSNTSFSESYNQARDENAGEYIKRSIKEIDEKAELLKNRIDMRDFLEYKDLIKNLLDYVSKNSNLYLKENKLSRGGNLRTFGIIKKINQELDELTKEFLKEEKDKLKIIETVSGITGLLVDINT